MIGLKVKINFLFNMSVFNDLDKKNKSPCGHCINCLREENCGTCQACKDAKRTTAARAREKCFKRQCLKVAVSFIMQVAALPLHL